MKRTQSDKLIWMPELEGKILQTEECCHNLWSICKSTQRLGEAISEFGVYKGGSARILCDVKGDRPFHLFDSFEGLPENIPSIDTGHKKGEFADTSEGSVMDVLKDQNNIHIHKGFFPKSAAGLDDLKFSFVHMDVDLYQSALDGLKWFYPRLVSGGILLSHDYFWHGTPGVEKAFQEFFGDMDVPAIRLHEIQCLVIKP